MTEESIIVRKEFPNGDVAVDEGNGLVYHTPGARYTVELVPPPPLSETPYGVDLVRTTRSEHGLERAQRLTLAEYRSFMSAEEHVREVEGTLLERGRQGLPTEMALVEAMPFEPDDAVYMVGLYPFDPDRDHGTLSLIRVDGRQLDVAAVAHGSSADLAPIEQRLWDVQAEGDPARLLDAAAQEAVRAGELAPGTPLFAREGVEQAEPYPPMGDDLIPTTAEGNYVPYHRDETGLTHFFAVVNQPEDQARELRYFRMGRSEEGDVLHHSLPVMPVSEPTASPWPLPALELFLEEGDPSPGPPDCARARSALPRHAACPGSGASAGDWVVPLRHRAGPGHADGGGRWLQRGRGRCLPQPPARGVGGALPADGRI